MAINSRRQLTYQMKISLVEQIKQNPHQTTKDLQKFFYDKYNWEICQTTLSCILKKEGLGIKKIGGKGRNSLSTIDVPQQKLPSYPEQQDHMQPLQYTPQQQHLPSLPLPLPQDSLGQIHFPQQQQLHQLQYTQYREPLLHHAIPHHHTPSPVDANFPLVGDQSPKTGYKIYNTNILCNNDEESKYAAVMSNGYPGMNHHHMSGPSTAPATPPSDEDTNGYTYHPRSQLYDINIINPHVKRFRPSSQYQQLEKIVLKLACDLHREHNYKAEEYNRRLELQQHQQTMQRHIQQQQAQAHAHAQAQAVAAVQARQQMVAAGFDAKNPALLGLLNQSQQFPLQNMPNMQNMQNMYGIPGVTHPYQTAPTSPPLHNQQMMSPVPSPPAIPIEGPPSPLTNSEIVKRIKKEITTAPQYQNIQKPIYLNQFIHKCLRRYQFTDELIDRLSNVNPLSI